MRIEKLLFWLLLLLLLWAPIPLGSNRVWAWATLAIAVFVLVAAWLVLWALGRLEIPACLVKAWPALLLLGLWLVHVGMHLVPLPVAWVELLAPEAARLQHLSDAIGVQRTSMTLSVDPAASRLFLLRSLAYAGVFLLVLALANNRARVATLVTVLVGAAVLHAIYAMALHVAEASQDHFGTVIDHGPQASGAYANAEHFAGYLEMALALGMGLLVAGLSDRRADGWKRFVSHLVEWILSPKMILRLSLCVLALALAVTHSRMGNTAFLAALLAAGLAGIALSRHAPRNTVILLAGLVAIDLAIAGTWFGMDKLAEPAARGAFEDVGERERPVDFMLPMIRDHAVFGAGPGSFYATFPRYRPGKVSAFFDHAHNDYAQLAAETGLVGLGLLGLLVAATLGAALRAQWERRDPLMRGMAFACTMGVAAILIHSWMGFNLQIPANACLFMVLLALGWISLHLDRREADLPRRRAEQDTLG